MSMRASTRNVLSICAAALLALSVRGRAQATCPAPRKPSDCAARVPGTPLPFVNKAAPLRLDLKGAKTVDLVILGHSESRGYHSYLLPLLKQQPPIPGVTFNVSNRFIGGHEAWRWATPGQRGYKTIQSLIQNPSNPIIVLGLFSNNVSFPIRAPSTKDANYVKFADNLEKIADLLHNGGKGVLMTYLSAHRYKPKNLLPSYYENCAIRELMARASSKRKAYLKAGPEQHDLHWCCYPNCYAKDLAHTNQLGDQLMARTWHAFLVRELAGCSSEPYGRGTPGTGAKVPVLAPSGGFSRLGNAQFGLAASNVLGNTAIGYLIGAQRLAGPFLLARPDIVLVAATSTSGQHKLPLPVPANSGLQGASLATQVLALDPGAANGLSATQGLAITLCR